MVAIERNRAIQTWPAGGMETLIRINISVGVKSGMKEAMTTGSESGLWVTIIPRINGMISR